MGRSVLDLDVPGSPFSSYFLDSPFSQHRSRSWDNEIVSHDCETAMDDRCPSVQSNIQAIAIITCITASTAIGTILSGLVTVSTPVIASELHLGLSARLWPTSIISLTCGSSLLLAGSLSDIIGGSRAYIIGSSLQLLFALGCGISQSGTQLIVFRGLGGIATALCLSSTVNLIDSAFPGGRRRNLAFASMGGGQPVGFGVGVTLGGVTAGTIGWRWAFRITCLLNLLVLIMAGVYIPKIKPRATWRQAVVEIDWIGALLLSSSFAMLLYVLSFISGDISRIKYPQSLTLLTLAIVLLPGYFLWAIRRERRNRQALIPNSVWKNSMFTAVCLNVYLIWAAFNGVEQLLNSTFQRVRHQSSTTAALQLLPSPVSGTIASAIIGLSVNRYPVHYIIIGATLLSCASPILLAVSNLHLPYWAEEFPSVILNSTGADALFIISNLLITSLFTHEKQGLAGGVFNTVAQIGRSSGITVAGLVSDSITASSSAGNRSSPGALMEGYRAASWLFLALNVTVIAVTVCGLRHVGKAGRKQD